MKRKRNYRTAGKARRKGRGFVWLVLILTILCLLYLKMKPVVEQMATYQVKIHAAKLINEAMINELESSQINYADLVHLEKNTDGKVTSIQTNVVAVNRLKTSMVQSIVADLEELGTQSVYVPVGTLSGTEWFSGRGPLIELKLIPSGYVQSDIYNSFTSAGINQTHHQIMLKTTVQIVAIIPGYSIKTETTTEFCVAETIIVGEIPEAFIQVTGDSVPAIARIEGAFEVAG